MFTCIICLSVFSACYCSQYVCVSAYEVDGKWKSFCDMAICTKCVDDGVNLPRRNRDWNCSYKCLLLYLFHATFSSMEYVCESSIVYQHHIEAEIEIRNMHKYTILIKEVLYPNELAKLIVEY